jgi:hypothetical protein
MVLEIKPLGGGVGYLKAGLLGFNKSGKTFTATEIAIGTRKTLGLDGSIAMFDTEASAQYVAGRVKKETGKDLIGVQARSLEEMIEFVRWAEADSHPWKELMESFKAQVNAAREKKRLSPIKKLQFQHWADIKGKWAVFSDIFLNSKLHIVICGRAGYDWDFETDDEGNKDLIKTGKKMKTEGEFGFEPSLLIDMDRIQKNVRDKGDSIITHRATVIGDRFNVIDGKVCDNPTFEFFKPYVDLLKPGAHASVDTEAQTDFGITEEGDTQERYDKRRRVILTEEIQGLLVAAWPGQSAAEKKSKQEAFFRVFETRSWSAVEAMDVPTLKAGFDALPDVIEVMKKMDEKKAEEKPARKGKK